MNRNMALSNARGQMNTRHVATLLDLLVIDYISIRETMPNPKTPRTRTAPQGSREYGHPAQWASDTAKTIADCLDTTDEAIRDHLGHLPPPPRARAESRVVNHAYLSIKARIETLADYPGTQAFIEEANEIHNGIRRALGHNRQRNVLAVPCPGCSNLPVFRTVYDDRRDVIECPHCGYEIKEMEYGLYARILVDELIRQADTLRDLTPAPSQCEHIASGETLP